MYSTFSFNLYDQAQFFDMAVPGYGEKYEFLFRLKKLKFKYENQTNFEDCLLINFVIILILISFFTIFLEIAWHSHKIYDKKYTQVILKKK